MLKQLTDSHAGPMPPLAIEQVARILVVDDDPIVRLALSEVLTSTGYLCDQASTAAEALDLLNKNKYSCVLTDLVMPGKNGLDLLRDVTDNFPDIVVVLISGQNDVENVRKAMRNGAYDYVVKPLTISEILSTVQGALGRRHEFLQEKNERASLEERVEIGLVESLIFEDIIKSTIDGIMITDLGGRVIMVNPAFEKLTGYSKKELVGTIAPVFRTNAIRPEPATGIRTSLNTCGSWSGELFDQRKDHSRWYGHISITRVKDPQGRAFADVFIVRDITDKKDMERQLLEKLHEVQTTQDAAILGFAKLAEYRDPDTGFHLERVRNYCRILAEELVQKGRYEVEIPECFVDEIYKSSPLHDIGKIGIPDSILLKPGRLTVEEYQIMKTHTLLGGDALASVELNLPGKSFLSVAKEIAYYHHEKFNGKGYPFGLTGKQIPLAARIVAFADAFDALTSKRVYKGVVNLQESKKRLLIDRGEHFDPVVVDAFLSREADFTVILSRFSAREKG
jgi:PAS domain S-box-containing protein